MVTVAARELGLRYRQLRLARWVVNSGCAVASGIRADDSILAREVALWIDRAVVVTPVAAQQTVHRRPVEATACRERAHRLLVSAKRTVILDVVIRSAEAERVSADRLAPILIK